MLLEETIIFFVVTKFESFTPRSLSEKNSKNEDVYILYTAAEWKRKNI